MSNKLRVLFTSPSNKRKGGVTNYSNLLMSNIDRNKFDFKYLSHGRITQELIRYKLPFRFLIDIYKFVKNVRQYNPDLIHINTSLYFITTIRNLINISFIRSKNKNIVYYIHGWNDKAYNLIKDNRLIKNTMNSIDKFIVLSEEFKYKLSEIGIPLSNIYVSSPMLESKEYAYVSKTLDKDLKFVFCGNIKREKGIFIVLDFFREFVKNNPDSKLAFVGSGKNISELKSKCEAYNLTSKVEIKGYIDFEEKIKIFKDSHIFLLPTSHGEGFPAVIIEAMCAGMAIISTPVGATKDIILDGKNGYLIKSQPPNIKEIIKYSNLLYSNRKLLSEICDNNSKDVKEKYDVSVITNQIQEIYLDGLVVK